MLYLTFSDQTRLLSFLSYCLDDETNTDSIRKRDDKPRTKIVRLVKGLTSAILKKIVSVGDYKHTDEQRLTTAYKTAFTGFININEIVIPGVAESIGQMVSLQVESTAFEEFMCIHYPKNKVESLATGSSVFITSAVSVFLKERSSTSVKKLKAQMSQNKMLRVLFEFASKVVGENSDFPKSAQILTELSEL